MKKIILTVICVTGFGCGPDSEYQNKRSPVVSTAKTPSSGDQTPKVPVETSFEKPKRTPGWEASYCQALLLGNSPLVAGSPAQTLEPQSRHLLISHNKNKAKIAIAILTGQEALVIADLPSSRFSLTCPEEALTFGNRHLVVLKNTTIFNNPEVDSPLCEIEDGTWLGKINFSQGLTGFRKIANNVNEVSSDELKILCGNNLGYYEPNNIRWVYGLPTE